jgi:apolipoprotein N-acyltransferase
MNLLQQITQLLNDAPGNLVYHLVTLLSIQVVFAISWGIWQRDPDNDLAKRSIWASAGVFAIRLVWLLVSLIVSSNAAVGAGILPPLEQAVHTITAVLLVWALSPPSRRWPPIGNALAGLGVMVVIVMYIFFTQTWITQVGTGQSYNRSDNWQHKQ